MNTCDKCGAPLENEAQLCPNCAEAEAAPAEETVVEETVVEETAAEAVEETAEAVAEEPAEAPAEEAPEAPAEEAPEAAPEAPAKKRVRGGLIAIIAAAVLAVGALVFWLAGGFDLLDPEVIPDSYIHEADYFTEQELDRVVARCGSSTLTNRKLVYYYWSGFYQTVNTYGEYITYVISDPYARLDTVTVPDGTETWDHMLMESAIENYNAIAAAAQDAKKAGFVLPENKQVSIDSLESTLSTYADTYGFESADDYLQQSYGPYVTLADYRAYLEEYYLGTAYLLELQNNTVATTEEIAAYYEAHAADYQANGIHNNGDKMVNVRHILIAPAAVELSEGDEGYEEAVAEAREAARADAEAIYEQWLASDMTEETFAELASTYTTDPGSMGNGGLYTDVYPGQMVASFNDWCFDPARQPGDTDIVESNYGFHIMFYSSQDEYAQWESYVAEDVLTDKYSEILETLMGKYPVKTKLQYAAVYPCNTEIQ